MGPFQEYQEPKASEKESGRSRIPRLVLRPYRPKQDGAQLSDSPGSEEESRVCDLTSDHSKRTISTNSFCSDDTGCPSSQSASPSGSENSPTGSPSPGEHKVKAKRVRVDVMAEWSAPPSRHRKEKRSSKQPKGSEVDFSSSSSAGSIKARETPHTAGKKASSSHSRGAHTRGSRTAQKPAGSPAALWDKDVYGLHRPPPKAPPSSNSSSSNSGSSPVTRRFSSGQYHSCGDNHGIKPPNPEKYLTPLQQKEVTIRHLKSKLKESESRVSEREAEVEELKAQLGRMREDWIEEECHRVEAQLALKEARKEIKRLRQVVEAMKNSLMEKDKGIQKYFIDINIQNKKLESLLHSMEMAQGGSLSEGPMLDYFCDSQSGKPLDQLGDGPALEDQAAEKMADSSLLVDDEMANRADILENVLMSTALDSYVSCSPDAGAAQSGLQLNGVEATPAPPASVPPGEGPIAMEDKAVQTDIPDLHALLLQLLKLQGEGNGNPTPGLPKLPVRQSSDTPATTGMTPSAPPSAILLPADASWDSGQWTETTEGSGDSGQWAETTEGLSFSGEQGFDVPAREAGKPKSAALVEKRHWSNSVFVDLVALAAPMLPTVAWLCSHHRGQGAPVYNIGALIRGCCILGLHSLRQVYLGPAV